MAGLALGAVIAASHNAAGLTAISVIAPLGTLWVNAILASVLPLVVSSLVEGIGGTADVRLVGQLGWRAAVVVVLLLAGAAVVTALITPPLLAWLPIDPGAAASLRESAPPLGPETLRAPLTLGQWLVSLVPVNVVRAAAEGALLPLVVSSVVFALALTRIAAEQRARLVSLFSALAATMRVIVGWILSVAPIGVFALSLDLGARAGVNAAGALVYYVVLSVVLGLVLIGLMEIVGAVGGGVSLRRFARAAAPAQAVAISARSSLAALPALVRGADEGLGLPPTITGFFLPLAASTFRAGSPIVSVGGLLFMARVYGVPVTSLQLGELVAMAMLLSFSIPGVPNGSVLVMAPILAAAGIPAQALGLLLALETIPDMARTAANVTGDMAAASVLGRLMLRRSSP